MPHLGLNSLQGAKSGGGGKSSETTKIRASKDIMQAHPWVSEVLAHRAAAGSTDEAGVDDAGAVSADAGLTCTDQEIEDAWDEAFQQKRGARG